MRHGISEAPGTRLEQKDMPNDETRAKLAMIEKMAMDVVLGRPKKQTATTGNPRKDHIISRLRRAKKSER
jgi:hypothetical protein